MNTTQLHSTSSDRGSVYLMTLVTVAAIVSMVFIGVSLRQATNSKSALIEQMSEANNGVLNATEYALEVMGSDPKWVVSAQSGKVFKPLALGESTIQADVVDTDTGSAPTHDTTSYRVSITSENGTTRSTAQIEILGSKPDYVTTLKALGATHYWRFNEPSSSTVSSDVIGNYDAHYQDSGVPGSETNNEGALVPVFADSNDYVQVPWGNDFKKSNGSISLWMNLTNTVRNESSSILGMLYQSGANTSISLIVWKFGLHANINENGGVDYGKYASSYDVITPNTWHHVVMTWGAKGLYVYVDGVEVARNTGNTDGLATANVVNGGHQSLRFGGGYYLLSSTRDGFDGSIAHMVFIPNQLNATQIAELSAIKPDLITLSIVEDSWVRVFE